MQRGNKMAPPPPRNYYAPICKRCRGMRDSRQVFCYRLQSGWKRSCFRSLTPAKVCTCKQDAFVTDLCSSMFSGLNNLEEVLTEDETGKFLATAPSHTPYEPPGSKFRKYIDRLTIRNDESARLARCKLQHSWNLFVFYLHRQANLEAAEDALHIFMHNCESICQYHDDRGTLKKLAHFYMREWLRGPRRRDEFSEHPQLEQGVHDCDNNDFVRQFVKLFTDTRRFGYGEESRNTWLSIVDRMDGKTGTLHDIGDALKVFLRERRSPAETLPKQTHFMSHLILRCWRPRAKTHMAVWNNISREMDAFMNHLGSHLMGDYPPLPLRDVLILFETYLWRSEDATRMMSCLILSSKCNYPGMKLTIWYAVVSAFLHHARDTPSKELPSHPVADNVWHAIAVLSEAYQYYPLPAAIEERACVIMRHIKEYELGIRLPDVDPYCEPCSDEECTNNNIFESPPVMWVDWKDIPSGTRTDVRMKPGGNVARAKGHREPKPGSSKNEFNWMLTNGKQAIIEEDEIVFLCQVIEGNSALPDPVPASVPPPTLERLEDFVINPGCYRPLFNNQYCEEIPM